MAKCHWIDGISSFGWRSRGGILVKPARVYKTFGNMVYNIQERFGSSQGKQEDFFTSEFLVKKYSATLTADDKK